MKADTQTGSRMSAAKRRALIMDEAGRLFGARGYAGTRLDAVAAAAGVTKPIVYRHFASKKALYLTLLQRHEDDLPSFFAGAELELGPARADVVNAILDRWLDYVAARSYSWQILFRDYTADAEIEAARRGVSRRAREVLAAFICSGPGAIPADQVEQTAEFLTSGLAGLVLWWIDNPDVSKARMHAVASRVSLATLGP